MEFKHKGDNDRALTYFVSSASGDGYFTERALHAGNVSSNMAKSDFVRIPMNSAAIQRELEKERIRDEIIAEERRVLEMEVRRELLLERELSMQRARAHGFSIMASSASMLRSDQRVSLRIHPEGGSRLEESFAAFPTRAEVSIHQAEGARLEERLSLPPPSEVGLSLQRSSEPRVEDVKPLSEVGKGQVLFFAKPTNSSLAGMKRKVVEPPPAPIICTGELMSVGTKKKPQQWSCAICQVSATSESSLNDHLRGKKHKAKEVALLASKTSKNIGGSTSSTKSTDEPTMTENTPEKQPLNQDGDAPVQKKQKAEDLKNKGEAPVQEKQKPEALTQKFKFWCELCKVGAAVRSVMNSHQRGKKHRSRLEKLKKENGSIPGSTTSSESTHEKPENIDIEAKEANGETENIHGELDGVEEADKEEAGEATEDESAEIDMVDRLIVEESTEF